MMSPRSFLITRQNQLHNPPTSTTTSTTTITTKTFTSTTASPAFAQPGVPSPTSRSATSVARRKDDRAVASNTSSSRATNTPAASMAVPAKRRDLDTAKSPHSLSPPTTTTNISRPTTPSSPVQIPVNVKRESAHRPARTHRHHAFPAEKRASSGTRRTRDVHSPDAIPPSVAALLAITSIPPPKRQASLRPRRPASEKRMTVESIMERKQEMEKDLSFTLGDSPLDMLLSPPEDLEDDDVSISDSTLDSTFSTRTVSLESMPSLTESFATSTVSSIESPCTPGRGRRRSRPTRKTLTPVSSPPGEKELHPLSESHVDVVELDFTVAFQESPDAAVKKSVMRTPFHPLGYAFKSNLTASLRALRNAARSFSNLNLTSIPPDDFLTRSILNIDPQVPFTDERRPPPLEEEPNAALRRYLNPTTTARIDPPGPVTGSSSRNFTASIQMQTYRVLRSKSAPALPSRIPRPSSSAGDSIASPPTPRHPDGYPLPGPRQREMRENSDFIRIAVMEMAMRKRGKLDDQRPGRARWALSPRKVSTRPYEIGPDGVPARWTSVTN